MSIKICKGKSGEDIARRYLEKKGYSLICQNWTCRWGELDLVFLSETRLVFVEVKTRFSCWENDMSNILSFKKKLHLIRSIGMYLKTNVCNLTNGFQVDLVLVTKDNIKHFANIGLR